MSAAIDGATSSIRTSLGGRSSAEAARRLDPAAVAFDVGSQGIGDRLRAAFGHHPTSGVTGDDQHHPDSAGHVGRSRRENVCAPRRPRVPWPAPSSTPETRRWPAAWRGRRSPPRSTGVVGFAGPAGRHRRSGRRARRRPEQSTPSPPSLLRTSAVRSIDRYITPADPSSSGWAQSTVGCSQVSRSGAGPVPRRTVTQQRSDERRSSDRAPGRGRSSPSCVFHRRSSTGLEHGHVEAGPCQRAAAASPFGPLPTTIAEVTMACDAGASPHARPPLPGYGTPGGSYPGRVHVTVWGIGPLGSHGCSL